MIGRRDQRDRLDDLVAAARAGRGGALHLFGEPGIGKSALLADAAGRADGVRVLSVTGLATEAQLPYAVLALLLAPILGDRARLAPIQSAALEGALALAPPSGADRLATLMAVGSLMTLAAADTPLLVVVDDLQWLDDASLQALRFVAAQTPGLPIALVLAGRERVDWPVVRLIEVPGLDHAAALELLGDRVSGAVADRLVAATGGNPLALLEVPRQLTAAQRSGAVPLDEPLPAGATLERLYRARLAGLPSGTRAALVVVAASESGSAAAITAALSARGERLDALLPAEAGGFVRLGAERFEFVHPLVRAAVYHGASAAARRSAHADLATAATDGAGAAWHRALAATGPDEDVARALEQAGDGARLRGAPATAAAAYERAAALSVDEDDRIRRMIAAAGAATLADRPGWALELVDRLPRLASAGGLRADALLVRAGALIVSGRVVYAHDLLVAEAAELEATDAFRAARLLCEACGALMPYGDAPAVAALAARALALARHAGPELELVATVMLAHGKLALDDDERARGLLESIEPVLLAADPVGPFNGLLVLAAMGFLMLGDHARAELIVRRIADAARAGGAFGALALALGARAAVRIAAGQLDSAARDAAESLQLAEPAGLAVVVGFASVNAAAVAARRGDAEACERAARAALASELEPGVNPARAGAEQALGLLALGQGDAETAIGHLEAARAASTGRVNVGAAVHETDPLLVDAYLRVGRPNDARVAFGRVRERARRTGSIAAAAAADRCAGLLAADADFADRFDVALDAYDRVDAPFERALTELSYGERLRRRRHPTEARRELGRALGRFEAIGATVWADRARQELSLSGERAARSATAGAPAGLTAQEQRVCESVALGSTNREVAAALYLSPRTVEHHLRLAYRKLGVRSRTELAAALAAEAATPRAPARSP